VGVVGVRVARAAVCVGAMSVAVAKGGGGPSSRSEHAASWPMVWRGCHAAAKWAGGEGGVGGARQRDGSGSQWSRAGEMSMGLERVARSGEMDFGVEGSRAARDGRRGRRVAHSGMMGAGQRGSGRVARLGAVDRGLKRGGVMEMGVCCGEMGGVMEMGVCGGEMGGVMETGVCGGETGVCSG
jgi:hypothetical protein